jgi:hypothetical protein
MSRIRPESQIDPIALLCLKYNVPNCTLLRSLSSTFLYPRRSFIHLLFLSLLCVIDLYQHAEVPQFSTYVHASMYKSGSITFCKLYEPCSHLIVLGNLCSNVRWTGFSPAHVSELFTLVSRYMGHAPCTVSTPRNLKVTWVLAPYLHIGQLSTYVVSRSGY